MDYEIKTFSISADKVNIDSSLALRYLRVRREPDEQIKEIYKSCLDEFLPVVSYKACYRYFDIDVVDDTVHFADELTLQSEKLSKNLLGCKGAFVLVATTSISVDRLIQKHSTLRISRALVIDAIGSAAVEAFANTVCSKLSTEYNITFRPRFSPGYGDLSIVTQKDLLSVCDASRKIGVTLNSNHMMIPTKTISAIVGVRPTGETCDKSHSCDTCENTNCQYRE